MQTFELAGDAPPLRPPPLRPPHVALASSQLAAVLLVVAAVGHLLETSAHGASFGAVGVAQLVAAGAVLRHDEPARRVAVVGGLAVLLGFWAASRTVGLPFGPHAGHVEAIGPLDGVTVAAQVATIALLVRRGRAFLAVAAGVAMVSLTVAVIPRPAAAGRAVDVPPTHEHDAGAADRPHAHP